jgi:hypothetical protein
MTTVTSSNIKLETKIFEYDRLKSDGMNFGTWRAIIELVLINQGLLGYADGSIMKPTPNPSPPNPPNPPNPSSPTAAAATSAPAATTPSQPATLTEETWIKGNSNALLQIMVSVDEGICVYINDIKEAAKAWSVIKKRFEGKCHNQAVPAG